MKTNKINIVLLIDGHSVACTELVSELEDSCRTQVVLQAANYRDAMELMEGFKPDYVLMDVNLSGSHGMSLLESIRNERSNAKVVVITSLANKHYREFCEERGLNYFLDNAAQYELVPGAVTEAVLN